MRKRRKQIIVAIAIGLGSLSILVVAGGALMFILGVLEFFVGDIYIERNPERMLSHLEKTFIIDFPEGITKVKAAKTQGSWDGAVGFMVKFAADPNTVDRFLKSFQQKIELYPYNPELDTRGSAVIPEPEWFAEPIRQGKEASPILVCRQRKEWHATSIYIDTTNKHSFVVYFEGGYDSELDY